MNDRLKAMYAETIELMLRVKLAKKQGMRWQLIILLLLAVEQSVYSIHEEFPEVTSLEIDETLSNSGTDDISEERCTLILLQKESSELLEHYLEGTIKDHLLTVTADILKKREAH